MLETAFIHHDISQAKSLPPSVFSDNSFLQLELDTIFSHNWLLLPNPIDVKETLSELVKIRGNYIPTSLLDEPILLWRDYKNNKLHCYSNICSHAWYNLVTGAGRGSQIQCEQHGRVFHCMGKCVAHKGFGRKQITSDFNLKEFDLGEWEQFLFVNFSPIADSSFDAITDEIKPIFENISLSPLSRSWHHQEVRLVQGNWKQYVINFLDKYHLAFVHPSPGGLAEIYDMPTYTVECGENVVFQWVYTKSPEYGIPNEYIPNRLRHPEKRIFALYCFVFPNMAFNLYPWGLGVYVWMPTSNPLQTRYYWHQYILDEEKFADRNKMWLLQMVNDEDIDAMQRASVGLKSRYAERGSFALDDELGPHWFSRLIYTKIRAGIRN